MSALRERVLTIVLIALATTVSGAGLELTARVLTHFDILDYWKPIQIVWTKGTDDYRLAHLTMDKYQGPDPVLIWKPVPSGPYNAQSFKGPLMAVPKPAGVFRIMCYGDSNTDGPDTGAWPARLQALLEGRAGKGGLRYEVVNAGVAGYSSHQGLLRFQQEAGLYQPDLVTVSYGWNDAAEVGAGRPDREYQPSRTRVRVLRVLLKSRFYLVLMRYVRPTRPSVEARDAPRVSLPEYLSNMESFAEVARQHRASIVFLTRPHREREASLRQFRTWERQIPEYNSALRLWAQERGLPLVDVQAIFERAGAELFVDKGHFTDPGYQLMAETLATELAGRGLMPAAGGARGASNPARLSAPRR